MRLPSMDPQVLSAATHLYNTGCKDPSVVQIADVMYGDLPYGHAVVEDISGRLSTVRRLLSKDPQQDWNVVVVNKCYYTDFRRKSPRTSEECDMCIPRGSASSPYGLKFYDAETARDLLLERYLSWKTSHVITRQGGVSDELANAAANGNITTDQLLQIVRGHIEYLPQEQRAIAVERFRSIEDLSNEVQ